MSRTLPDYPTTRLPDCEARVWEALRTVHDPEIPTISIVDLGVVHAVEVDGEEARVALLPTFVACPAIEVIRREVEERVAALGSRRACGWG
ncbi:MAG: iron-sulfur cluster assembly protein [Thermomicrobiales bacterium]